MRGNSFPGRASAGVGRFVPATVAAFVLLALGATSADAQRASESAPRRKPGGGAAKPAAPPVAPQAPEQPRGAAGATAAAPKAAPKQATVAAKPAPSTTAVTTTPGKVPARAKSALKVAKSPAAPAPGKARAVEGALEKAAVTAPAAAPIAAPAPATAPAASAVPSRAIEPPPAQAPPPAPGASAAIPSAPAFSSPPRRTYLGTPDALRSRWRVELPVAWVASPLDRRVSPGLGVASPGGYGPAWGDAYGSASYQARTRRTKLSDAGWGVGIGLGDPARYVGAELAYAGFGTARSGLFTNGTVSARLHRIVAGYGVTIGRENIATVGATSGPGPDGGSSNYVAVSRLVKLGVRDTLSAVDSSPSRELLWTIGVGDGRFRREPDVLANKAGVNVFGSVGWRFHERLAAIVDYTGQDVAVALSMVPFRCFPLVVTPGMADVAGMAGDGARFVLGIGVTSRLDPRSLFTSRCAR